MSDDEKGLRDSFDDLRRAERSTAPSFHHTWNAALERSAREGPRRRPALLAAAALLLIVVGSMVAYRLDLVSPQSPPSTNVYATTAQWSAPTDFLLHTPASALSSTVPSFTNVPDYGVLTTR